MAYQLIFTSSPVSLTTGRTGFSTVARTSGMPEKLAAAVERCSVYEAARGAVYSHRILSVGSQKWYLLSKIKDAGVDYTNRNNFLAHHLILSPEEAVQLNSNPAEILLFWGGWLGSWSGEPRYIEPPQGLSEIKEKAELPAREWEKIFSDAGKAALLGASAVKIKAEISSAETLLRLYAESLRLFINPGQSWEISFTTHFNASENPRDFIWRAGSGAEFQCEIDVEKRLCPPAPDNRSAEYARTGIMNNREKFNLKVSGPDFGKRKFNVVADAGEDRTLLDWKTIIVASCAVAVLAVAAVFAFFGDSGGEEKAAAREVPKLVPIKKAPVLKKSEMTLSETRDAVRLEIENGNFQKALLIWDRSTHSKNDPSYRKKILSDIGHRADSLMDFSEKVFSLESASQEDYSKAISNVFTARRALDITGVPRIEERMKTWKTLNDKIKK